MLSIVLTCALSQVITNWIVYILVYIMVILGVYLCTSIDLLLQHSLRSYLEKTKLSEGVFITDFGRLVLNLIESWHAVARAELQLKIAANLPPHASATIISSASTASDASRLKDESKLALQKVLLQ